MGHYDGYNYNSSINAFLDAGGYEALKKDNEKLEREVLELRMALKLLLKSLENSKETKDDYICKMAIKTAEDVLKG
jgi:hypothetical protein